MFVYLVVYGKTGEAGQAYWTADEAARRMEAGGWIMPVYIEPMMDYIDRYFQFRELAKPENIYHALSFLTSELGELADAVVSEDKPGVSHASGADAVSSDGSWVRNHPDKERSVRAEAGDVLMMLYVTMHLHNADPMICMMEKFKSKGFVDATKEAEYPTLTVAPDLRARLHSDR
jgi:NTP pyrophosphatase (non-canonical NTP hydrolase)